MQEEQPAAPAATNLNDGDAMMDDAAASVPLASQAASSSQPVGSARLPTSDPMDVAGEE